MRSISLLLGLVALACLMVQACALIPAGRKVAVYCATDTDAAFAVQTVRVYVDREAFVLQGGIVAWQAAGMPVVT